MHYDDHGPASCARCGGALGSWDERCRCGGRSAAWSLLTDDQRDDRLRRQGKLMCPDHNRRDDCWRPSTAEERGWHPAPVEAPEVWQLTGREALRQLERKYRPSWMAS